MSVASQIEKSTPELMRFMHRALENYFPKNLYKAETMVNPVTFGHIMHVMHMPSRYYVSRNIDFDLESQVRHLGDYTRHILDNMQKQLHYVIAMQAPEHLLPVVAPGSAIAEPPYLWAHPEISALFKLLDLSIGTLEKPQSAELGLWLSKKGVWARGISTTMLEYDLRMWQHYLAGVADREAAALAERAV